LGNFYVNFSIKTVDGRHVAELLRGRRAFITTPVAGWTLAGDENEEVACRPVDIAESPDGTLFVSDDYAGAIYRITPAE
jgi:glucose/arabinose dehydrogenase